MNFNKIIKTLIISDFFILTGFGLVQPIIAIYINQEISGGNILTIGIASSIFMITKSVLQVPFSKHVDKYNDSNDLKWLIIGAILTTITPIIYLLSTDITHIFIAQFVYGIGSGLSFPSWLGLWSTHLDEGRESFEWSFYSTMIGLGTALTGLLGGLAAKFLGFQMTFLIVMIMSFLGSLPLIYFKIKSKGKPYFSEDETVVLDFPELRQAYGYDCGAIATQAVLAFFGLDIREELIMKEANTTKDGTSIEGIVKTLEHHGLKCKSGKFKINQIKNYIGKNLPVILDLQAWPNRKNVDWENVWDSGHYVVAIGYDDKNIYFEDPWTFLRTYLSYKELKKRWHDTDLDGTKRLNYGIVAYGKRNKYNSKKRIHME